MPEDKAKNEKLQEIRDCIDMMDMIINTDNRTDIEKTLGILIPTLTDLFGLTFLEYRFRERGDKCGSFWEKAYEEHDDMISDILYYDLWERTNGISQETDMVLKDHLLSLKNLFSKFLSELSLEANTSSCSNR